MPKQGGKFVLSSAEESQLTTALVLLGCIEAYAVSPPAPSYSLTDIGVLPGFTATQGSSTMLWAKLPVIVTQILQT